MAMVNGMISLQNSVNVKDSRWLTLEVCREFQRNKCTRTENECKFAHPPPHVEVQNGRVTACFDSIKAKCQRKDPPCKYLHPPQHLREQLLQNGRHNLILRNLQMQAAAAQAIPAMMPVQAVAPTNNNNNKQAMITAIHPTLVGQYPMLAGNPYGIGQTTGVQYSPYITQQGLQALIPSATDASLTTSLSGVIPAIPTQQKVPVTRADRLEVCREFQRGTCTRLTSECRYAHPPENVTVDCNENQVTVCMDFVKGKCTRDSCKYFHPPAHLQTLIKATQQRANNAAAQAQALPQMVEVIPGKKRPRDQSDDLVLQSPVPGMIPYKRLAVADNKSGLPMYQPAYQPALAAMQLNQQQYIASYAKYSDFYLPDSWMGTLGLDNKGAYGIPVSQSSPIPQSFQAVQLPHQQLVPVTIAGHPPSLPRF